VKRFIRIEKLFALKCLSAALTLCLGGCAALEETRVINKGDLVSVHYACRLKDGRLVDTNRKETALQEQAAESGLFKTGELRPLVMRAGGPVAGVAGESRQKSVKDHIAVRLSETVVGLLTGEERVVEIPDELLPDLGREDRFLTLARIWRYPKKELVPKNDYEKDMGSAPEVGDEIPWRAPFTARVEEVGEHFVNLTIDAPPGKDMETPFGLGKITDGGERWVVEVNAREGTLVRSGPLLGRISEVSEEFFQVDFGYAFGNEPLLCEVTAEAFEGALPQELASHEETTGGQAVDAVAGTSTRQQPEAGAASSRPEDLASRTNQEAVSSPAASGEQKRVEKGDLVEIRFSAALEDGTLIYSTVPNLSEDRAVKRIAGYDAPEVTGPVEVIAGEKTFFPGLDQVVIGMAGGEKKVAPLIPELAFGPKDPKLIEKYDAVKRYPRVGAVSAREYQQRFSAFPVVGKEIDFTPYFKSRILEVREDQVVLQALARDGERVPNEFGGYTEILTEGDEVILRLVPEVGAAFTQNDRKGYIAAYDQESFTVNYNHPLAGKPVILEAEVVSVTKASGLKDTAIPWIEDYDRGLDMADELNKPVVLVLYSPTCGWSKRLLEESANDLRIKRMAGDFIWVKVDSSVQRDLFEYYEQDGYPLTVLLDHEGNVLRKINGYRPGNILSADLKKVLEPLDVGSRY